MKKIIITTIVAVLFLGGVAGVAWATYPGHRGAQWDSGRKVWVYFPERPNPLKVSYDLTNANEYRDQQRHFSFRFPKSWKFESFSDGRSVEFYVERDSVFWAPERRPVLGLVIDGRPETDYYFGRQKEHYHQIEKEQVQWLGALPWIVIDLPPEHHSHGVTPYPKGVLEFGTWRLLVRDFRSEIFKTFRYDAYTTADNSQAQPWPKEPGVDTSAWKDLEIPTLGVAVKYPPDWHVYDCLEKGDRKAVVFSPSRIESSYSPDGCRSDGYWKEDIGIYRIGSQLRKLAVISPRYSGSELESFSSHEKPFRLVQIHGYWDQKQIEDTGPEGEVKSGHPMVRTSVFSASTRYSGYVSISFTQRFKRDEQREPDLELKKFKAFIGNLKAIPLE